MKGQLKFFVFYVTIVRRIHFSRLYENEATDLHGLCMLFRQSFCFCNIIGWTLFFQKKKKVQPFVRSLRNSFSS